MVKYIWNIFFPLVLNLQWRKVANMLFKKMVFSREDWRNWIWLRTLKGAPTLYKQNKGLIWKKINEQKKNTCNWQTRLLNVKHYYTIKWEYVQDTTIIETFRAQNTWIMNECITYDCQKRRCNVQCHELWTMTIIICHVVQSNSL